MAPACLPLSPSRAGGTLAWNQPSTGTLGPVMKRLPPVVIVGALLAVALAAVKSLTREPSSTESAWTPVRPS